MIPDGLIRPVLLALVLAGLGACGPTSPVGGSAGDAQPATVAWNDAFTRELDLDPAAGLVDAKRGFIARPSGRIVADDGTLLHDFDAYAFVDGKAPATVNPSLWRPRS